MRSSADFQQLGRDPSHLQGGPGSQAQAWQAHTGAAPLIRAFILPFPFAWPAPLSPPSNFPQCRPETPEGVTLAEGAGAERDQLLCPTMVPHTQGAERGLWLLMAGHTFLILWLLPAGRDI